MTEFSVRTIVDLIDDIDMVARIDSRSQSYVEYIEVERWNKGGSEGGQSDDEATAIFRALLREKLGTFPLNVVGGAVIARIDERSSDA